MRWVVRILAFAACCATVSAEGLAVTELSADLQEYYYFQTPVPVSGEGVLVGLTIGPKRATARDVPANPKDMLVPLDGLAAQTHVCVTANTRDGLYWAQLHFDVPPRHEQLGVLRPSPAWRYAETVKSRYDRGSFAAFARIGPECDTDPASEYVPIVYAGGSDNLTIAVNSHGAPKVSAELSVAQERRITVVCDRVARGARSTGFDSVCTLNLSSSRLRGRAVRLVIRQDALSGPRRDPFTIRLP